MPIKMQIRKTIPWCFIGIKGLQRKLSQKPFILHQEQPLAIYCLCAENWSEDDSKSNFTTAQYSLCSVNSLCSKSSNNKTKTKTGWYQPVAWLQIVMFNEIYSENSGPMFRQNDVKDYIACSLVRKGTVERCRQAQYRKVQGSAQLRPLEHSCFNHMHQVLVMDLQFLPILPLHSRDISVYSSLVRLPVLCLGMGLLLLCHYKLEVYNLLLTL